jgi:hypothetical protein
MNSDQWIHKYTHRCLCAQKNQGEPKGTDQSHSKPALIASRRRHMFGLLKGTWLQVQRHCGLRPAAAPRTRRSILGVSFPVPRAVRQSSSQQMTDQTSNRETKAKRKLHAAVEMVSLSPAKLLRTAWILSRQIAGFCLCFHE